MYTRYQKVFTRPVLETYFSERALAAITAANLGRDSPLNHADQG